jgi:hypothetical protein
MAGDTDWHKCCCLFQKLDVSITEE